jgi:hypothetical protein
MSSCSKTELLRSQLLSVKVATESLGLTSTVWSSSFVVTAVLCAVVFKLTLIAVGIFRSEAVSAIAIPEDAGCCFDSDINRPSGVIVNCHRMKTIAPDNVIRAEFAVFSQLKMIASVVRILLDRDIPCGDMGHRLSRIKFVRAFKAHEACCNVVQGRALIFIGAAIYINSAAIACIHGAEFQSVQRDVSMTAFGYFV